ncbi:MAG: ABC transporter permease [Chloroflexota bacterium]
MKLFEFLFMALGSLRANKLRSALTMLGIIIGVSATITLMSVGRGAQATITAAFEQLGSNVLYLQPRNPAAPGLAAFSAQFARSTLTLDDNDAILKNIPYITASAPTNENYVDISFGNEGETTVIHGSTPDYANTYNYKIGTGQFFSERNVTARDMVVVLGSKLAEDLFGERDPIGLEVGIKNKKFTVIGVLEPKGGSFFGFSMDKVAVVPITTYQIRLFSERLASGEDTVQSIAIQVSGKEVIEDVKDEIETLLRKRHKIDPDEKADFAVITQEQYLSTVQQITGVFTIFLGTIAGISLIVGGIGIMNIMLVSVTERTREIGLRKAIGAKRRDILTQFLIEASVLSLSGGGIGIALGYAFARIISAIDVGGQTINAVVTTDIVTMAISVSVIIGLASGVYPALRAARLDPITALRYG